MLPDNERRRPGEGGVETPAKESTASLDDGNPAVLAPTPAPDVVARFRDAFAVVVIGKAARRHVFFGLPAAQKAVERARARGDFADLVLVHLVPVGGGAR